MKKLTSTDSKFVQVLNRFVDLVLLNLLFIVTSIPVITVGAAANALYASCQKLGPDREEGTFQCYFRAFAGSFGRSTGLWLIYIAQALILGLDVFLCRFLPGALRYFGLVFILVGVGVTFIYSHVFPLTSRFHLTVKQTLSLSLQMTLDHFPRTLAVFLLNVFPYVLPLISRILFMFLSYVFLLLYLSMAAYITTRLLKKPYEQLARQLEAAD